MGTGAPDVHDARRRVLLHQRLCHLHHLKGAGIVDCQVPELVRDVPRLCDYLALAIGYTFSKTPLASRRNKDTRLSPRPGGGLSFGICGYWL